MLKYIKSLFRKKNNYPLLDDKNNKIVFTLSKDGLMDLEIVVFSNDHSNATHLADLLYSLNNGVYADEMVSTVMQIGKNNPKYIEFANMVILRWHAILNLNKNAKTKPVVLPSQFGLSK
jgi:hypothetical protein